MLLHICINTCNGKFSAVNAMAKELLKPVQNSCVFSFGAAKELLICFPVFLNPIGLEKPSTSIPMFFLSLHVFYPVIQRGPKSLNQQVRVPMNLNPTTVDKNLSGLWNGDP